MTHMALIDPPQEVQQAVTAIKRACADWRPIEVQDKSLLSPSGEPPRVKSTITTEAKICSLVNNPDGVMWDLFIPMFIIVGMIWLIGWMLQIHKIPMAIFRLARWSYRRVTT